MPVIFSIISNFKKGKAVSELGQKNIVFKG